MTTHRAILKRILEELPRYIFNEIPCHLIHLESVQLCDRHAVLTRCLPTFNALTPWDIPQNLRTVVQNLGPNSIPSSSDTTAIRNFIRERLRYAILSDRWGEPEPAYGDIPRLASSLDRPRHYDVAKFCDIALKLNMQYAWADSCCIDKSSDAEVYQSIRSMYRWYANSSICIVHLRESTSLEDLGRDDWFREGWTLMQLLAPAKVKFYMKGWAPLTDRTNDKEAVDVLAALQNATSISPPELRQFSPRAPGTYQISKRMRWAAGRRTALAEDRAYSLMGVFGVIIDVEYGEGGVRAFSRLLKEIVQVSNSPEVVNWVGRPSTSLSLWSLAYPSSPDAFVGSDDVVGLSREEPVSLASNGLSIKLLILPATLVKWERNSTALVRCFGVEVRAVCFRDFLPGDPDDEGQPEYALGGWNFSTIGGECKRLGDLLEVVLLCRGKQDGYQGVWSRIPTQSFIRIELGERHLPNGQRWGDFLKKTIL